MLQVIWRHVIWGLGLQLCFGLLILRWEVGKQVFKCIGDKVNTFLSYTDQGSSFVFGFLVNNPDPDKYVFAFTVSLNTAAVAFIYRCLCVGNSKLNLRHRMRGHSFQQKSFPSCTI